MNTRPIIIDCDPGVDDALALYFAFSHKEFNIKAITVVGGNVSLDKTASNAINLVDYLGVDVKVAKGAKGPLLRNLTIADEVHGESGIGDVLLNPSNRAFYEKDAVDTIREEVISCNGDLHIIALGPLTNIATAFLKYPEIKEKINGITLMGGATKGGNVTPVAEFNIYVDPEAAKIVFESGVPITMVGLDATHKCYLTSEEVDEFAKRYSSDKVKTAIKLLKYTEKLCLSYGHNGIIMHDPTAVAYVMDQSLLNCTKYHVDIETKGELTRGKTVADIDNVKKLNKNVSVALDTNREKFVKMVEDMLNYYDKK